MSVKSVLGLLVLLSCTVFWAKEAAQPQQQPVPPAGTAPAAVAQATHDFKVSAEDAARKNPVRITDVSVSRGKKIFLSQCAMCHGDNGAGKGDLAEEMKLSPPDLTNPSTLKPLSDGALFAIISAGNTVMPAQGSRMKDYHKWCVVDYLRSLGGAAPQKATPEEIEQDSPTSTVAPVAPRP